MYHFPKLKVFVFFLSLLCQPNLFANREIRNVEKKFKGEFRRYGMSLDIEKTMKSDAYGTALGLNSTEKCLKQLFSALNRLDPNFVKRCKVKNVFFRSPLIDPVSGKRVAGLGGRSGNMWFSQQVYKNTIFHELFHVFDKEGKSWSRWDRTNPRGFTYTGSVFRPEDLTRREERKNKESLKLTEGASVSNYARSNQLEDRAETFSYMIMNGYHLMDQAERKPYLQKKIDLIVSMTSASSLLGRDYWDTLLAKNIEDIKKFSSNGFACRLIIDLEKKLIQPSEVIKIRGKEYIPLIFALEANNTELIKLLCINGVNTNIKSKQGKTPLEMAIRNENEIQIQTLIDHGAKVSTPTELKYLKQ